MRSAPGPSVREIAILNPNRYPEAAVRRLRPWLEGVLEELAPEALSFGVRFAGDRELRRANREYRGKDYATDVLSFPGEPEDGHLGDVLISVPRARHQALEAGHDAVREVEILLLHGILHCLGHDHETDGGTMERLERRLRKKFLSRAR
ncbi:MAG TPA: rRNA maturation RNase YbeY [Thermoanaerobaculia bacterium]|nr:rRNA maturation RNase YbeY [Thermoanaerobaculia bacterium]